MILGGHRGMGCTDDAFFAFRAPDTLPVENTLLSFQRAFDLGADYVECDAVLSADGVAFCLHNVVPSDHFFTTPAPSRPLNQMDWADIAGLNVGRAGGGKIARLEDVLAYVSGLEIRGFEINGAGWIINIELKGVLGSGQDNDSAHLVAGVYEAVRASGIDVRRVLFSSFALSNILAMKALLPEAKYGMLFAEKDENSPLYNGGEDRYLSLTPNNLDFVFGRMGPCYVHPEITTMDAHILERARDLGVLGVNIWAYKEKLDEGRIRLYERVQNLCEQAGLKYSVITDYLTQMRTRAG